MKIGNRILPWVLGLLLTALACTSCGVRKVQVVASDDTSPAGVASVTIGTEGENPDVMPQLKLSAFDFSGVDRIYIQSGRTGAEKTVTKPTDVDAILQALTPMEGADVISNRGYYGFSYHITLYRGDEEIFSIGFSPEYGTENDTITGVALLYGRYETASGHDYPCRYLATDTEAYKTLDALLATHVK